MDFPNLFIASDAVSLRDQKRYFRLQKLYLVFLFAVSLIGSLISVVPGPEAKTILLWMVFFALFFGVILLWVLRAQRYEKTWFDCRAIAESVKMITWKFVIGVEPYGLGLSPKKAEQAFIKDLKAIRESCPGIENHLVDYSSDSVMITQSMREIRADSFKKKKDLYLKDRLSDQRAWYQKKALYNKIRTSFYYWAVFSIQMVALLATLIQLIKGALPVNVISLFMALAASFLAWSQMKNHMELSQSYSSAHQDLLNLEADALEAENKVDFGKIVNESEGIISREHALWCVRRNTSLKIMNR